MLKLTSYEKKLLNDYEKGNLKSVPNLKEEIEKHQQYAKATLKKNMRINIRLPALDVESVKRKAFEDGMPYQTLISSVIHKYVMGRLVEKHV